MTASNIKASALKLFALNGYEATTMRDIATDCGLRAPSIYSHFESKNALFLDLVSELFLHITWEIDEAVIMEDFTLREVLFDVFKGYYHYFSSHELELKFWQRIRFLPPAGLESGYHMNQIGRKEPLLGLYLELFNKAFEKGQISNENIEMKVMTYFAFVSGYVDSLLIVPFTLADDLLQSAFNIYWKGIK